MKKTNTEELIRPFDYGETQAAVERDMVNSPAHYNQTIECIDAMKAMADGCDIDSHKYLWRWPYKNGVEDLKKCRWYLDRLISELESEK
jgi:hypothetical protein